MYYLCKQINCKLDLANEGNINVMNNKIKHTGVVDHVENGCVVVKIMQSSACSACKVAAHCNASETKEKMVEVQDSDAARFAQGDRVVVVADSSVGFRASLYGYLLPLVLMVATLVVVLKMTQSEGVAALLALGILIPYYIGLYLMRNKLRSRLQFSIER